MNSIIERLEKKIKKLTEQLKQAGGSSSWGSQRKEFLLQQISICQKLLIAYKKTDLSTTSSEEVKKILNQQCEFNDLKKFVLEEIKIGSFLANRSSERKFSTLLLVGPPGIGKTSFCKLFAQALNKPFLSLALGGESKSSILVGTSPETSRSEVGRITKFLAEEERKDPVILLDELDKTLLHDSLISILDPTQNQNIYDRCLDLELDFSKIIFIATANDLKKIPVSLRSRMTIVELESYSNEAKKTIARHIIQTWFKNNSFDCNWLEISDEVLEEIINKTQEKGVRQLAALLENNIFHYCLLEWAERKAKGEPINEVVITADLVKQLIPHQLPNIDENGDQENHFKQLENLQKELKIFRTENNKQLRAIKLLALHMLQPNKDNFDSEEYSAYEQKINNSSSWEEIDNIQKEILTKIKQKNASKKPPNYNKNQRKLSEIEQQNAALLEKLRQLEKKYSEISNPSGKGEQSLQANDKFNWTSEKNPWLIFSVVIMLIFSGVLIVVKKGSWRAKTKKIID